MSNINDDFDILSIEEIIQPPSVLEIDDISKEINQEGNFDLKGIQRLQEYERNLVKLDRQGFSHIPVIFEFTLNKNFPPD